MSVPVSKKISIDHHATEPVPVAKCILCLDPLEAPCMVMHLGTWTFHVDDDCWDQLNNMANEVREAHKDREGVIMH